MKRIFLFLLLATVARGATYDYPVKTATNALSASKALTTDANGKAAASATTSTEIGYVSGVTSAIQTQLNAKGAATNGTFSGGTFTGATNVNSAFTGTTAFSTVTVSGTITSLTNSQDLILTANARTNWTTQAQGSVYGSGNTGAAFPFQASGNIIIQSRVGSGNSIVLATGNPGYSRLVVSPSGNVGFGETSPQYLGDFAGQIRIMGTNGMRFGGTSGATDDTVRISQTSANALALTATTTTVSGGLTIAGTTILTQSSPPANASAAGTVGTIAWDADYIYICTAANTWKRVAISTW